MHMLRAIWSTITSGGWFPFFSDLAATTSQNIPSALSDSATTHATFPFPDLHRNWSSAVLLPDEKKVYIIPSLSDSTTNHGNRGLIYDIDTDTYTFSSAVFQTPAGSFYYQIKDGVLLSNGKIFISRGYDAYSNNSYPYYLYDIKTDTLQALSSTNLAMHAVIKLKDDKVFIYGFTFSGGNPKAAAIFNPEDNSITSIGAPPLGTGSDDSRLILLPNGKLLLTSGTQGTNGVLYDQDTNTYTSSTMPACSGACLMDDGRVFYIRALSIQFGLLDTNGYIWNPTTNTITTIPNVLTGYDRQAALSLLPDGRILIISQGAGDFGDRYARIFNPISNATTQVSGGLAWPGGYDNALLRKVVLLTNGKALVISTRRWHSGNKFQLISGLFSSGVQFPIRQLKGSYLHNTPWYEGF